MPPKGTEAQGLSLHTFDTASCNKELVTGLATKHAMRAATSHVFCPLTLQVTGPVR